MTDAKAVRFAAVLVVLAGYAFVFRGGESRIGDRLADNARIVDRLRAGERMLASRAELEAEGARIHQRLGRYGVAADRGAVVARFVRDAAALAAAHNAAITAIAANGAPAGTAVTTPATNGSTAAVPGDPFDKIPLEIVVEGRYADVLATMRALSAGPVLASVDVTSVARKNAAAPDATLTASLHVVLERILPGEPAVARTRPV